MKEISVTELKQRLDSKEDFQLIDVREVYEHEAGNIGGDLIPMGEVLQNLDKIAKNKDVVIYCRSGNRSGMICKALEQQGYTNLTNLKGGMLDWAAQIDPSVMP